MAKIVVKCELEMRPAPSPSLMNSGHWSQLKVVLALWCSHLERSIHLQIKILNLLLIIPVHRSLHVYFVPSSTTFVQSILQAGRRPSHVGRVNPDNEINVHCTGILFSQKNFKRIWIIRLDFIHMACEFEKYL